MLLRLLLRFREGPFRSILSPLLEIAWNQFWKAEEREEARELNSPVTQAIRYSERAELIESIAQSYPFTSVLEVGSGFGQNFITLAKLFPDVSFVGIDKDPERVFQTKQILQTRKIDNVVLYEADARRLSQFSDNSFDVVYSSAMFLYLTPEGAKAAAAEMLRLAKRSVILLEQHDGSLEEDRSKEGGVVGGNYWIRNYESLFCSIDPNVRVVVKPVPQPRWGVEAWRELATIICLERRLNV